MSGAMTRQMKHRVGDARNVQPPVHFSRPGQRLSHLSGYPRWPTGRPVRSDSPLWSAGGVVFEVVKIADDLCGPQARGVTTRGIQPHAPQWWVTGTMPGAGGGSRGGGRGDGRGETRPGLMAACLARNGCLRRFGLMCRTCLRSREFAVHQWSG